MNIVEIGFGAEYITARWGIGSPQGPELCWEAPPRAAGEPAFWETEDAHALVTEVLAVAHFTNVDTLRLVLAHEDAHVPTDAVLFVDDAEPQAGKAPVEVVQHLGDRRARRRHARGAVGVGGELRGDGDADHGTRATVTE